MRSAFTDGYATFQNYFNIMSLSGIYSFIVILKELTVLLCGATFFNPHSLTML